MAVRYRAKEAGRQSYPFPATQTHLADATGMTPVHVNRTLKALRQDGLAAMQTRHVEILDWDRLRQAGEFDPGYLTGHLARSAARASADAKAHNAPAL
jgi:hypothetical protein